MQTVQIQVYEFNELDEDVRDKIVSRWRDGDEFFWFDEWMSSLETFADWFGIEIRDCSVGAYGRDYVNFYFKHDDADFHFDCDESHERSETRGIRLFKMLLNQYSASNLLSKDCPFTGYFGDEILLNPIREFMRRPDKYKTFHQLIEDCIYEWIKAFRDDHNHWLSDECIAEEIEANGHTFLECGTIYQ